MENTLQFLSGSKTEGHKELQGAKMLRKNRMTWIFQCGLKVARLLKTLKSYMVVYSICLKFGWNLSKVGY